MDEGEIKIAPEEKRGEEEEEKERQYQLMESSLKSWKREV